MSWFNKNRWSNHQSSDKLARLIAQVDDILAAAADPRAAFSEFSRLLEGMFDLRKGFLALREEDLTRFLAIASWRHGGEHRVLSLRLPQVASLFEKVAETGHVYSESFSEFFDGNRIERSLLFDKDTVSFMLRPLKHDARVVGLIGYSSDVADAFVIIEDGRLDPIFERLATYLGRLQSAAAQAY